MAEAAVQKKAKSLATNPWYVVFVLVAGAILSYLDRGVVSILVPDLRRSLGLTEVEISVIQGFAFSVFFAIGGLFIGALADRVSRKLIVICGVLGWSAMTVLCGLAQNFEQLFAARAGVGIGEACLSPAAFSLISDLFSPERRGRPMSFMTMAAAIGGAASSLLGGLILKLLGGDNVWFPLLGMTEAWRATFILVGAPGALIALLVLTIREPVRSTHVDDDDHGASYTRFMLRNWRVFVPLKLMISLTFSISYIATAWVPTALIRNFGYSAANAGITLGLIMVPSSVFGALAGGVLGDWIAGRGRPYGRLRAWFGGMIPVLIGAALMASSSEALFHAGTLMVLVTGGLFASMTYPALYDVTPRQFRGRAIGVLLLLTSAIGIGGAITAVALLTEHVFQDDMMVSVSIAITTAAVGALAPLLVILQLKPYEEMRLRNVARWSNEDEQFLA